MNEDNASYTDINGGMLYFILIYFLSSGINSLADTSPSNIMFLLHSILLTNTPSVPCSLSSIPSTP